MGIRTASHAFSPVKGKTVDAGNAEWPQWDAEVIGGSYTNHHGKGATTTVHPLGGCAMADSAAAGVVDDLGRVFDALDGEGGTHAGLAVLDGAIVPRALAINPALTIAALAERALPGLAEVWGFELPAVPPEPAAMPQPRWAEPESAGGLTTAVRFTEALEGPLQLAAGDFWARLELRFAPVADLLGFVSEHRRAMTLEAGRLLLVAPRRSADDADFDAAPEIASTAPLATFELAGSMQVLEVLKGKRGPTAARRIAYELTVTRALAGDALAPGARLIGVKTLEGTLGSNALRQLSVMTVRVEEPGRGDVPPPEQEFEVDLGEFVRRQAPLFTLHGQADAPGALA